MQGWYQRRTIYAFTSRNEGFGLTLIEAMSSGGALAAARRGAAEFVVEDGRDRCRRRRAMPRHWSRRWSR